MQNTDVQRHEREHGYFYHPRTGDKIECLSEVNTAYKTVSKDRAECKINGADFVISVPRSDKVNAFTPQVAYHRIANAICETPIKLSRTADQHVFFETPETTVLRAVNTKKHFYGERKHGYASRSMIETHQTPRFIKPMSERPRKLRITASGKLKLRRF